MVTSRPSKADELRGFADVHAEITGFSREDVGGFMRRMLGNNEEATDLWNCLFVRELLDLASFPLLLLFYCTLWKKGKWKSFPENRTELYVSIVQCLLDYGQGKRAAGCYSKVEDHKEILAEMGKVALEALLKDDLVFDYDELLETVRCEGSRIIGLLQVTEYAENVRPAGKVSFIHKSIQEFLAAWYITHRCISEGNLGPVGEIGNTFENCLSLKNVLLFVCGLSVDGAEKVFALWKSLRMRDPTFDLFKITAGIGKERKFYDSVVACFGEANFKEELLKHCLDCTGGIVLLPTTKRGCCVGKVKDSSGVKDLGGYILTNLFHASDPCIIPGCLNVALSIDEISEVLKLADFFTMFWNYGCSKCRFGSFLWLRDSQIQFYITGLKVSCDKHALILSEAFVGPVLSHSADSGSSTESSTTLSCRTRGEEAAQCSSSPSPTNKLETFCGPPVQPESCFKFLRTVRCGLVRTIPKSLGTIVNKSQHLSSIAVCDADDSICNDSICDDSICDLLRQVSNPGNCSLKLYKIFLTSAGAVHLASLLPRFNNISIIELDLKDCSGSSVSTLVGSITRTTLKTLSLRNIDLIPEAAVTLGCSLSVMSGLEELCLVRKGNSLGPGEMESLFGGLKEKIPLQVLELCCFCAGSSTAPLRDSLRLFPDMRELNLEKLEINEDGITVLAEGFRHLPNLKKLNLSGNPLGHGVRSVMSHITNLSNLWYLNLSNTGCTEDDVEYFHEGINTVMQVKYPQLYLSCNPLGHGVRSIVSHITNFPKQGVLDLCYTGCTEEDVRSLRETINSRLQCHVYIDVIREAISLKVSPCKQFTIRILM